MLEIEFRGRKASGEWVYGDLMTKYVYHHGATIVDEIYHEVDPVTIGQFTGLKDKNETRVYRGDIVQLDDVNGWCSCGWNHSRCEFAWYLKNKDYLCPIGDIRTGLKVVGNIHDNPEFLLPLKEAQ